MPGTSIGGKTVLITGCSSGFGRGMAVEFLASGWTVLATMRDPAAAAGRFDAENKRHDGRLRVLKLDVTSAADRRAVLDELGRGSGGLDCLVNNAGYGLFGALEDLSEAQFRHQMEVNFFGAALMTREFLPLLRRSRGRIINVSSVLGYAGLPLTSAYCASKFALEGLTEALYYELRPLGVQVALVEPGRFRTRFGDNVRWGEACASPGSAYRRQTENYRRYKESLSSGSGIAPEAVVRAVVKLAGRRVMPLRTRAGGDARAAHLMKSVLPQGMATGLVARIYDRILMKEPSAPTGA